jgi:hypothetical protein
MYVLPEIWEMLQREHEDEEMEDRLGSLQADLELFVEGQPIDPKYLFLLYPARQAVWVLGLFAKKNVFVATNFAFREDLGEWQSREWKNVKRAALAGWRRLFHPNDPLESTNIQNLVTGAINGKYFK